MIKLIPIQIILKEATLHQVLKKIIVMIAVMITNQINGKRIMKDRNLIIIIINRIHSITRKINLDKLNIGR